MGELGWLGLPFPEAAGGLGGGFVDAALVLEQLGTTLVPEPYIASVLLGGMALCKAGDAGQQRALARADDRRQDDAGARLGREQTAATTLARVSTRAEKKGGGYVLSGQKVWVLHGDSRRSDRRLGAHRGSRASRTACRCSWSIAARRTSTSGRVKTMDGRRAAHARLARRERAGRSACSARGRRRCRVSRSARSGARPAPAPKAPVLLETVLAMTRDYLRRASSSASPIGSFQALQHRAVDMFVESAARQGDDAAGGIARTTTPEPERKRAISAAKVQLAQSGQLRHAQGIQLHGGIGVTDEHDIGLYFKRMHVLNALFGDEEHHTARFSRLPTFELSAG